MTATELRAEIKRRSPWYQSITFPKYGISTTDDPSDAMLDAAFDNQIGGISLQEAARLRPQPKWNEIRKNLPSVKDKDVLEIGCNCGFFSFQFAAAGAATVLGLDVAPQWLDNANWARDILGHKNVQFLNCDFMRYSGHKAERTGLLATDDESIPLPSRCYDLVFMSTVLDHLFFPLLAIYKMCRISRHWVAIDVPLLQSDDPEECLARLSSPSDKSHHAINFTKSFLRTYIQRLGIQPKYIHFSDYNNGASTTILIDVRAMNPSLHGA